MEDRRVIKKVYFNGKFHNTRQVGKTRTRMRISSEGTRHRSVEYENGEDEQKTKKNGGVV
jgi:hypothetical protein